MAWYSNLLKNEEIRYLISIILSILVPMIIMEITRKSDEKISKIELRSSQEQFKATLQNSEKQHIENMESQEINNRISVLPFLFLNQNLKLDKRDGRLIFPLEITNLGNGVALDINIKFTIDKNGGIGRFPYVYKKQISEYLELYMYTGFLYTNVLPVNSKASFELLLNIYEDGKELIQENITTFGEVLFTITYKDSYYNNYEQKYMFQYGLGMHVGRVESYLPCLVENNT